MIVASATEIFCRTPAGTPGAIVDVSVTNSIGVGRLSGGWRYAAAQPAQSDLNADGIADLVIGASSDDTNGLNAGAVYVFFGSPVTSDFENRSTANADLVVLGQSAGDAFGASVTCGDVDGDERDDLVVGAPAVDGVGAPDAGAIYVFNGPLGATSPLIATAADVKLSGASTGAGDHFGSTIELAHMVGDGNADIVVCAPEHDVGPAVDAGCVYVFGGGPTLVSGGTLTAAMHFDGAAASDRAGARIACGDLNGDGRDDLVVCAPYSDPILPPTTLNAGRVYVIFGDSALATMPVSNAEAVFTGAATDDRFGTSAVVADLDGDGIDDLVVGSPLCDSLDVDAGRVYVFRGSSTFSGRGANQADAFLSGMPTHNSFGQVLSASDVNGDSLADLWIGAPHADYLNDGNGRAYLFYGRETLVDLVAVDADATFNGDALPSAAFGSCVGLLDINADGFVDPVCSSPQAGTSGGRVYLWFGGNGTLLGQYLANNALGRFTSAQLGTQLGASIARGN